MLKAVAVAVGVRARPISIIIARPDGCRAVFVCGLRYGSSAVSVRGYEVLI